MARQLYSTSYSKSNDDKHKLRSNKMKALADCAHTLVKKNSKSFQFLMASIKCDWAKIVGPQFANFTAFEKVSWRSELTGYGEKAQTAVVHINAPSSAAMALNFQKTIILQRLNQYTGRKLFSDIRILHKNIEIREEKQQKKQPPQENILEKCDVSAIENDELRAALNGLGRWIS